jgi:acyl-CoA reductase-like NAD-dependent aldehyde dehydrogenase
MLVGGEWVSADSSFTTYNPATEKPVASFPSGEAKHVDMAVKAAHDALEGWSRTPAPKRGELLLRVAGLLRRDKERLGRLVATEMGKVMPEALGDVQEAIDTFEYFAG